MASLDDYLSLIPQANRQKPNFVAVLTAVVQPMVDNRVLMESIAQRLDLFSASGTALDMIGDWIGLARDLRAPIIDVYFSFDDATVGFDQGIWYNSSMPISGIVELDDETYRQMLQVKIAANNWDGSMGEANASLVQVFGSQGDPPVVWLTDNFDMSETMHIDSGPHSALLEQLVLGGYFPFKPQGVRFT